MTGRETKQQVMEAKRAPNGQPEVTAEARFWAKVEKTDSCWLWRGTGTRYGYLSMGHTKRVRAHRFAYELLIGPIPDGLEIDHLCRNPKCVNPAHMEPVTHRENGLRGTSKPAENARKTHCIHGHPFDSENTYIDPKGRRQCRACTREKQRHYYATRPAYKAKKDAHRG